MKKYQMVEINEGQEKVLVEGTEKELIKYWITNKEQLTDWIFDNATQEEVQNLKHTLSEKIEVLRELEYALDNLDYSFWKTEIR